MNFINTLRDLTLNNKTDTESTPPPTDVAPIPGPEPNTQSPCDPPQVADPTEAVDSIPQTTDPIVNPSGTVTSPTYEPTTSPHNRTGPIIAGYYANWGIYDRNYNPKDVDTVASKLTHVLYSFADMKEDGEVFNTDPFADREKHFPAELSVNGEGDIFIEGNHLYGSLKQFYLLKQKNPHLKISLSIGGATLSKSFPAIAADSAKRQKFVESSVKLLADIGFDGLDIDWEFPQNDKEAADYALLLSELRAALDQYGQQVQQADSPRLMLTVAVPCGPDNYRKLHLKDMEKYIDVFYLMAYDYSGDWDQQTGHQANLFGGPLNTDQAVNDYMAAGVPASKLVLGIPMYGRGFTNTNGPDCCYQGVCKGSWEAGQYDYKCLPLPGSTEHNDMEKMASWCYDPQSRVFVTYDSPQVVNGKCEYIKQKELAGAMFWELSADRKYDDPNSLINVVYNAFEGQVDQTPNHLDFPLSEYINIKNQMQQ